MADIIKFDFRATSFEEMADYVKKLSRYGVELLAEKVETYEEFEEAIEMGCKYFQGYFFSKPEILQGKRYLRYADQSLGNDGGSQQDGFPV